MKPVVLILEDNAERIAAFEETVPRISPELELKIWRDAPTMLAECEGFFDRVVLFSLDHDLNPQPDATEDPGTGLDVANFLVRFPPICPVVIHSTNVDRVWSMHNEFRFAGWTIDRIGPFDGDWIQKSWRKLVEPLLARRENHWVGPTQADHALRMERAIRSLHGLALGDALGEMISYHWDQAWEKIAKDDLPAGPWFHTDDTEMAISVVEVLKHHGCIHQEALARRFATRFERDHERGYGKMTRLQMRELLAGAKWRRTAAEAFNGQGSMGNGGAMRVAPLGAFHAGAPALAAGEAAKSSVVTHTHPEGIAGTIAVAVAASLVAARESEFSAHSYFEDVLELTPTGETRTGIEKARTMPLDSEPESAARILGNGSRVTAQDTVPYALWCAARHLNDFPKAIACAAGVNGDCDTNAAIAGGIVAADPATVISPWWLKQMEPIDLE